MKKEKADVLQTEMRTRIKDNEGGRIVKNTQRGMADSL